MSKRLLSLGSAFLYTIFPLLTETSVLAAPTAIEQIKINITRDEYGVPQVTANKAKGLYYGFGYAVAQDRLWQAEMLRRNALGRLSEILGADALAGDILARALFGPEERHAKIFQSMKPFAQKAFRSYAAGMNAWIEQAKASGQLPPEFQNFEPEPWTTSHSVAVTLSLLDFFGQFGLDEVDNLADFQALYNLHDDEQVALAIFADTHWLNDPAAPTTVPSGKGTQQLSQVTAPARTPQMPLSIRPSSIEKGSIMLQKVLDDLDSNFERSGFKRGFASSAFVVSPKLTAQNKPLLLGGPQMGYSLPSIVHEISLNGAGYRATGMAIAGIPALIIGSSAKHAWSWSSGVSDTSDIYAEEVNPADPGKYFYNNEWRDFNCRMETFHVLGGEPVTQPLCESVHGPVVSQADGVAFTIKNAARGFEASSFESVYNMVRAKDKREFKKAVKKFGYNFNVFYVDKKGNIAYWHSGRIPVRADGDNPWFPHDGTGSAEWQGFVAFKQMPKAVNPERGWMVSWNNKPNQNWANAVRGFGTYGPVHRVNTLINLMRGVNPGEFTVETAKEFNRTAGLTTDTPSGAGSRVFSSTLLDDLLGYVNISVDGRLPDITAGLSGWNLIQEDEDQDGRYDSANVAIFNTWWDKIVGSILMDDLGQAFEPHVAGNLIYRILNPESSAITLNYDYLNGQDVNQAITGALITALDDLTEQYGTTDKLQWLQQTALIHWKPVGAGQVNDTLWMNRGTYNQIVQPGVSYENVVAPGQSGVAGSPHFADQLPLYAGWLYKEMRIPGRPSQVSTSVNLIIEDSEPTQ